jgi:hypothetical protein
LKAPDRVNRKLYTCLQVAVNACDEVCAENDEFYHDRCIGATLSNFLLQKSKFALAAPKSLCYSQPEVGVFQRPQLQLPLRVEITGKPQQLKPKG